MCNGGFHREVSLIIIKAFYIHFSSSSSTTSDDDHLHNKVKAALPYCDFLTLRFLPRMNRDPIQIDGSIIAPTAAFLTLHRLLSAPNDHHDSAAVYGSRDRIRASEGDKFEIYYGDAKVLKGAIRKDEQSGNLKLDCKRNGLDAVDFVKEAYVEVAVDVDGHVEVLTEKVEIIRRKMQRNRQLLRLGLDLEEIPEEEEEKCEFKLYSDDSSGCCCDCDCGGKSTSSGTPTAAEEEKMDVEVENVRWAVDAAILVVSLGVGFLVSKKLITRQWKSII